MSVSLQAAVACTAANMPADFTAELSSAASGSHRYHPQGSLAAHRAARAAAQSAWQHDAESAPCRLAFRRNCQDLWMSFFKRFLALIGVVVGSFDEFGLLGVR